MNYWILNHKEMKYLKGGAVSKTTELLVYPVMDTKQTGVAEKSETHNKYGLGSSRKT